MENTGFNKGAFESFTPKISQEYNSKLITGILLTGLAVAAGLIVYQLILDKQLESNKSNKNLI